MCLPDLCRPMRAADGMESWPVIDPLPCDMIHERLHGDIYGEGSWDYMIDLHMRYDLGHNSTDSDEVSYGPD